MHSNPKSIELDITFESETKLIFYENGMSMSDFQKEIRKHFNFGNGEIKLIATNKNAEITSTKSFEAHTIIHVKVEKIEDQVEADQNPNNTDDLQQVDLNADVQCEIDFGEIIQEKFKGEELLSAINIWANKLKFKLVYSQGKQNIKGGFKRALSCQVKNCPYRMIFVSSQKEEDYKICEKLSSKYKAHSKFYQINF